MSFWQLFSSYMYILKAAKTMFVRKICTFNVDEIDYRRSAKTVKFITKTQKLIKKTNDL